MVCFSLCYSSTCKDLFGMYMCVCFISVVYPYKCCHAGQRYTEFCLANLFLLWKYSIFNLTFDIWMSAANSYWILKTPNLPCMENLWFYWSTSNLTFDIFMPTAETRRIGCVATYVGNNNQMDKEKKSQWFYFCLFWSCLRRQKFPLPTIWYFPNGLQLYPQVNACI